MNKFWNNVILPIIESINASYIVEVGSDTGINTRNILEYCVEHDAHMTAIDPSPNFNFEEFELKYEDKFEIYRELSISRLPLLENYDVILLDGDHNWYTVYNELKIIEKNFKNKKFPLVILHDIGWPYARRDLYYNPENIPEAYRQPYKKLGMYPGQTDLKNQGGLNRHLYNSIYENNPKNGTLTAVEDFIDESDLKFSFKLIKAFHGLGILFIKNDEMETIIKEIIEKADLLNNLEEERVKLLIAHSESNLQGNSLKKELNENKKKLEYVENRLNLTELKSANETKLIQKKEEQLKNIKDQLNQTKTRLDQTEGRFEQIKDHLNLSNELIQKKEEQLRNAKDQLNQTINNLKQTEIKLKSSNDLAKETKKQLEKTEIQLKLSLELIQEKEAFIDEIENELKQTKNQLESSNKLVQEKQSIIDNIKKKKKKTVKELNSQIDDLKVSLIEMEYLSNKDRPLIQRLISRFPSLYILFNMNETGFKHALINIKGHNTIKNDNLFDIGFYLKNNKSVRLSGMDPILHYLYHGFKEGKKPSPTFNSDYYLKRYKDVKNSNLNPLIHYGLYGKNEGRKTTIIKNQNKAKKNKRIQLKSDYNVIYDSGLFDADWYLKKNPDVVSANMDPLVHFIRHGANENRDPNPNFSISVYLQKNSDIVSSGMNPLVHYIKYGIKEDHKDQFAVNNNYYITKEKEPLVLTEMEAKEKYEKIINKNASLIDLYHFDSNDPLVSVIILNRNGLEHLKRLFRNFKENIKYPNYELIVVDNASTDNSINLLEKLSETLPIKIIKNIENKSFSEANNQAVKSAKGEYLLFLNNDIEPTYGWLNQMMRTALKTNNLGSVGAKLIYPDCSNSVYNKNNSFKIQHMGIAFQNLNIFYRPYNMGTGLEPFDSDSNLERARAGNTAAVLLVKKDTYLEVGGLDEGYYYGYEDVDFCLKLLKKGYKNIYCPKALLFHYEFGSEEKIKDPKYRDTKFETNKNLLISKWHNWISDNFFMDKLNNNGIFSENPLKVAFVVTESGENASAGDYFTALELGEALKKLGWEISFLSRRGHENWYKVGEDVDVLISLLDIYDPREIKCSNKSLVKIAWSRNWFDKWVSNPGFPDYDIIFASSETACAYIKEKSGMETLLLPLATNEDRFNDKILQNKKYSCDYCFTGSYWNDPREIIEMLDPESMPYEFKLYGKNWDKMDKFKKYDQGFLNYFNLPEVYASTKIVINDANRVTKEYGSTNSRVFDATASGALVLTNGEVGAKETFKGKIPVFRSKEELNELIKYYLENESARLSKVKELQEFVLRNHTYKIRADILKETLKEYYKTKGYIVCPICGFKSSEFLSFGNPPRKNVLCPNCGSLERHRATYLTLKEKTDIFEENTRMLHIAPEEAFTEIFSKHENIDYLPVDLDMDVPYVKEKMDIQNINYPDDTFDFILCSHVLEHVPNDKKAMKELYRVLKPNGTIIILEPINRSLKETRENSYDVLPELKSERYAKNDKLRSYGLDFSDKLRNAGFKVISDDFVKNFNKKIVNRYGLNYKDVLCYCTKAKKYGVSVLMPAHNNENTIERAINSVLNQTFTDYELIIVDTGSTDNTEILINEKYGDHLNEKIKYFKHENSGTKKALNKGLAEAQGKIIAYLDSGNYWFESYLEKMVSALFKNNKNTAYTGIEVENITKNKTFVKKVKYSRNQLLENNYIDLNVFVHKKFIYDQLGGLNESLTHLEDWDLILRYTRLNEPYFVDETLAKCFLNDEFKVNSNVNLDNNRSMVHKIHKNERIEKGLDNLNIGYVLWDFPAFSQTFVMNELRWLVENNYNVKVFYKIRPDKEAELDFDIEAYQIENENDLIEKIEEFDINMLHSHFVYPACTLLTYPAAKKTGVSFTVFAHAIDIFHHDNDKRNKIREISQSHYCKKIFVLGNFHYNYLAERGVPKGKLMLLRQATKYEIKNEINRDMHRFKREIKDVITVTRFVEKKGIDTLIETAKILEQEDLNFKIYGYGPLEEDLQTQINELNLKNVTIEGPIKGNAVKKAYLDGDIFVLPCRRASNGDMDGMPTVIFEAMAYGVPVITTNVSSIPEFVLDNYCGFIVNPNDPVALANKIQYVRGMDKNKLFTILKHAQKQVQKSSSVEETIETMIDIWSNNKIDLFMITYQKQQYKDLKTIKEILDRIFKHTTVDFDLTIVDNDSDEDFKNFIQEYARKYSNIRLVFLHDNLLCGPASNIALDLMNNDFAIYICSNEGFILKHGWEYKALKYMRNNKNVGIAGDLAYSQNYYNGKTYKNQEFFSKFRNKEYIVGNDDVGFKHVQGGIYILRRDTYEQCGGFNPLLPQGYMDVEYSYYLQSMDWELGVIPEWISLTKKTRPEFYAYLDENTTFVHPLKLEDVNQIENKSLNRCNICNGELVDNICTICRSDSSERAIYRIIGKTDKLYRSLTCTLLLKNNNIHEMFEKMFTVINKPYSTKNVNENLEDVLEILESSDVLVTNLNFDITNYEKLLKMMVNRVNDRGLLLLQLSNDELLNKYIKEFLTDQRFVIDTVDFVSNKLVNDEFLVAERDI